MPLNVKNAPYNARGNAREADAVVNSGSTTVVISSTDLEDSDVGAYIGFTNAFSSTISAVNSGTAVVLAEDITFSGSGLKVGYTPPGPTSIYTTYSNVTVTGLRTVTVPGATFTAADVGRQLTVYGEFQAEIVSQVTGTTSTSVVLSAAPTISLTKARAHWPVDTCAIQHALFDAGRTGDTVVIPADRYYASSLLLLPGEAPFHGLTIEGYGATLVHTPYMKGNYTRLIQTGTMTFVDDSPLVNIRGLTLDGNFGSQSAFEQYQLEHSALLFLSITPTPTKAGRLRARVTDVTVQNSVADGVSVFTNVSADIVNLCASECFRGGMAATGGCSDVRMTNYVESSARFPRGINVEVDGAGMRWVYGTNNQRTSESSTALDLQITNARVSGGCTVILEQDSRVRISDLICGPGFVYSAGAGTQAYVSNSHFVVRDPSTVITTPFDLTFDNVEFRIVGEYAPPADQPPNGVNVRWVRDPFKPLIYGQHVRFVNCRFRADQPNSAAVVIPVGAVSHNNVVTLDGCEVHSSLTTGFMLFQGGNMRVRGGRIDASRALYWGDEGTGARVEIDGVTVGPNVQTWMETHGNNPAGTDHIRIRNVEVTEAGADVFSMFGYDYVQFFGGRVITVNSSPIGRLSGHVGDLARLRVPVAGQPYEWACTYRSEPGSTPQPAVWKVVSTAAA